MDDGACISMPPEHWRATVLKLLHFTESHDVDHGQETCPECDKIASFLIEMGGA